MVVRTGYDLKPSRMSSAIRIVRWDGRSLAEATTSGRTRPTAAAGGQARRAESDLHLRVCRLRLLLRPGLLPVSRLVALHAPNHHLLLNSTLSRWTKHSSRPSRAPSLAWAPWSVVDPLRLPVRALSPPPRWPSGVHEGDRPLLAAGMARGGNPGPCAATAAASFTQRSTASSGWHAREEDRARGHAKSVRPAKPPRRQSSGGIFLSSWDGRTGPPEAKADCRSSVWRAARGSSLCRKRMRLGCSWRRGPARPAGNHLNHPLTSPAHKTCSLIHSTMQPPRAAGDHLSFSPCFDSQRCPLLGQASPCCPHRHRRRSDCRHVRRGVSCGRRQVVRGRRQGGVRCRCRG